MSLFDGNIFSSTISLLLAQILFILFLTRLLNLLLSPLKQPLVISEIICGIIVGPSVMGFIPNFSNVFFSQQSISQLNEIAQLGLVFYLFMVGLNLNPLEIKKNFKQAIAACIIGIILPFLVAIPVSFLLFHSNYTNTNFAAFFIFIGFCLFIPALAILGRILAEKRLIQTQLGVLALTSSAVDTLVGMILFAIVLAVSGGGSRLTPLWVVILSIAHILVLWYILKPILDKLGWIVSKKGILDIKIFLLICFMLFTVSWFTEVIGISASFGAFEFGLIIPRKGPLVKLLIGKIEDMVVGIFLPIFFTVSGIKTEFQLLYTGEIIGFTFMLIALGMISKGIGVFIAGKIMKLSWKQSIAFAILMSAKGLFALVMFNIAYNEKIITDTFFSMLVAYVLISLIITSPILHIFVKQPKIIISSESKTTFNILLIPQVPLLGSPLVTLINSFTSTEKSKNKIITLRLLELNDRMSEYMKPLRLKSMKYDEVLEPVYQRSYLLSLPVEFKTLISLNYTEDICNTIKEEQIDFLILGHDFTKEGEKILFNVCTKSKCNIGIFCGTNDLGLSIERILVPFLNAKDLINSFLLNLIHKFTNNSHCEIVLLHIQNLKEKNLKEIEETKIYVELLSSNSKTFLKNVFTDNPESSIIEELKLEEPKYKLLILDNTIFMKYLTPKQLITTINSYSSLVKCSILVLTQQLEEKKKEFLIESIDINDSAKS